MRTRSSAARTGAKSTVYNPTVKKGWEYWHFTNGSSERAAHNLIKGGTDAAVVGKVEAFPTHIRCEGLSAYLQTAYPERKDFTIYAVIRSLDILQDNATKPMFWGTYTGPSAVEGGGTSFGSSLFANSPTGLNAGATRNNGTVSGTSAQVVIAWDPATWHLVAFRVNDAASEIRNETADTVQRFASTMPRHPTTNSDRIGSGFISFGGHCDIAMIAKANGWHTEEQRLATLADIRRYMAKRGIDA